MLIPGPKDVKSKFVRKFMMWMGSVWGDKTPVMSVTRLSSPCKCLKSTQFCITVAMCLFTRVVARSSRPTTAPTDTRSFFFGSKPHHKKSFYNLAMWGKGEREEKASSTQLKEESRHPLPSQLETNYLLYFERAQGFRKI